VCYQNFDVTNDVRQ